MRRATTLILLLARGASSDSLATLPTVRSADGVLQHTMRVTPGRLTVPELGLAFNSRLYNGQFPASTLRARPGDVVRLTVKNELQPNYPPTARSNHFEKYPNTTNLHAHGLHISPSGNADNVMASVEPGAERLYEYALLGTHLGGTHWYHPHMHGSTTLQLAGGMSGVLIVEDDPAITPAELLALPEHVMLLQHVHATPDAVDGIDAWNPFLEGGAVGFSDSQLLARYSNSGLTRRQVGTGDAILVNGQLAPTLALRPMEWTRLRLVHATMSYNLMLVADGCELRLIANDGVYLMGGAPRAIDAISMLPGSRRDVLIRCADAGSFALRTARDQTAPMDFLFPPSGDEATLLNLDVAGAPAPNKAPATLPALPSYLPDLRGADVDGEFEVAFILMVGFNLDAASTVAMALALASLAGLLVAWKAGRMDAVPPLRVLLRSWFGSCVHVDPPAGGDAAGDGMQLLPHAAARSDEAPAAPPTTLEDRRAQDLDEERAIRARAAQPRPSGKGEAASGCCPCCAPCRHWLVCLGCGVVTVVVVAAALRGMTGADMINYRVFASDHGPQHLMRLGKVEEWTVKQVDGRVPYRAGNGAHRAPRLLVLTVAGPHVCRVAVSAPLPHARQPRAAERGARGGSFALRLCPRRVLRRGGPAACRGGRHLQGALPAGRLYRRRGGPLPHPGARGQRHDAADVHSAVKAASLEVLRSSAGGPWCEE